MNRADLTAVIKNLKEHGLTSPVEKLLGFVLTFIDTEGESLQQCEIIELLDLGRGHCINSLNLFVEKNILKAFGKRSVFYRLLNDLKVPLQDIKVLPQDVKVSLQDVKVLPQDSEVPLQDVKVLPQDFGDSPESPSPLNLTLVNLTKLNLTNKQDFENSFSSQAKDLDDSSGIADSEQGTRTTDAIRLASDADSAFSAQSSVPSTSTTSLQPAVSSPLPSKPPIEAARSESVNDTYHLTESAKDAQRAARAAKEEKERKELFESLALMERGEGREARGEGREVRPELQRVTAGERDEGKEVREDIPLFEKEPAASLYYMIQNMQGKRFRDPEYKPAINAPLIPMYDAFVKMIKILWRGLGTSSGEKEKPVFDFVIHRAAYMLVDGFYKKTAADFHDEMTFIRKVRLEKGTKPLYLKMVGVLKDCYEKAGLGWDTSILTNEDTYRLELAHADFQSKETGKNVPPRNELFPSYLRRKGLLVHLARQEEQREQQRLEMLERAKENAEFTRQAQEKRNLEYAEKKEAKERANVQNTHEVYQKMLDELEALTTKEREAKINATYPSALMLQTVIEQMPIQYRVVFVNELLTPVQRKKYGVKKISGVTMGSQSREKPSIPYNR